MTDQSEKAAGRPRVTFFVSAYNQEGIVHTAIEGAFAQAYQPLEIALAAMSPGRRLCALAETAAGSARHADWAPLRKGLRYALSPLYMSWHNIRGNAAMPRS